LGKRFNIVSMSQKNHAACGHAHAAIDAVLALREKHGLTPERIARITAKTYRAAAEVAGNRDPRTVFEAKFSLPYCLAAALVVGSVRVDAFADARLRDPAIRRLVGLVTMEIEPKLDAAFPKQRAAIVEIETVGGERLSHYAPTRKGDPDAPLSDAELMAKARELITPVLGASATAELVERLWRLDELADLTAILPVRSTLLGAAQ
jgi:2-methylcitrate dehydratase PrpD